MKKILFLSALFILLSGSYKNETKATSYSNVITELNSPVETVPSARRDPKSGEVVGNVGRTVYFSVYYDGYPAPKIEVFKNGQKVEQSSNITFFNDGYEMRVTIKNAKRSHNGVYSIELSNPAGKCSANFTVTISE